MVTNYRKVTEFKTVEDFENYLKSENIQIGLAHNIPSDGSAALAQKINYKDRVIGNRWAILPMEGWDCSDDGAPTEYTRRRWLNFAKSGAKLLYGTEAAAVTAVVLDGAILHDKKKVVVNRPFIFIIRDNSFTKNYPFIAKIVNL